MNYHKKVNERKFIDIENAFGSIDKNTLRNVMGHHGMPQKIVNQIGRMYAGTHSRVNDLIWRECFLTPLRFILTGVRQEYVLSPLYFVWLMKEKTQGRRNGIQ